MDAFLGTSQTQFPCMTSKRPSFKKDCFCSVGVSEVTGWEKLLTGLGSLVLSVHPSMEDPAGGNSVHQTQKPEDFNATHYCLCFYQQSIWSIFSWREKQQNKAVLMRTKVLLLQMFSKYQILNVSCYWFYMTQYDKIIFKAKEMINITNT